MSGDDVTVVHMSASEHLRTETTFAKERCDGFPAVYGFLLGGFGVFTADPRALTAGPRTAEITTSTDT